MTDIRVVLVAEERSPHLGLSDTFKESGFQVKVCHGGFDALDELIAHGAECVVASTHLPDLSGYQLSSLIKSNDKTYRLPVVLLASEATKADEFWNLAALADVIYSAEEIDGETAAIAKEIKALVEDARSQGWKPSLVKNFFTPFNAFSSKTVNGSFGALLDNLLIERMINRLIRHLTVSLDTSNHFAEAYFGLVEQLFRPDLLGVVIASEHINWSAYQVTEGLSRESFEQLSMKVNKQMGAGSNAKAELAGSLEEKGKPITEYEILPVSVENGHAALVFGSMKKQSFDNIARAFMTQLQAQMHSVVQLLLSRQQQQQTQAAAEPQDSHASSTDHLTGLYNLEFLIGFLQQQLLFSFRQRLAVGMAIVDIDNLAKINEEYGFEVGDYVITTIANRLLGITRSSDLIARYGGDEFAVVLPNTDLSGVKILAEKVRGEIEQMTFAKQPGRKGPQVTVSVGCSIFNMEDLNPETILRDAKIALQKAKESGRNMIAASV